MAAVSADVNTSCICVEPAGKGEIILLILLICMSMYYISLSLIIMVLIVIYFMSQRRLSQPIVAHRASV